MSEASAHLCTASQLDFKSIFDQAAAAILRLWRSAYTSDSTSVTLIRPVRGL